MAGLVAFITAPRIVLPVRAALEKVTVGTAGRAVAHAVELADRTVEPGARHARDRVHLQDGARGRVARAVEGDGLAGSSGDAGCCRRSSRSCRRSLEPGTSRPW